LFPPPNQGEGQGEGLRESGGETERGDEKWRDRERGWQKNPLCITPKTIFNIKMY